MNQTRKVHLLFCVWAVIGSLHHGLNGSRRVPIMNNRLLFAANSSISITGGMQILWQICTARERTDTHGQRARTEGGTLACAPLACAPLASVAVGNIQTHMHTDRKCREGSGQRTGLGYVLDHDISPSGYSISSFSSARGRRGDQYTDGDTKKHSATCSDWAPKSK